MAGNIREWVRYDYKSYDLSKTDDSPVYSYRGYRVIRGGMYASSAWGLRSVLRQDKSPWRRNRDLGFRFQLQAP